MMVMRAEAVASSLAVLTLVTAGCSQVPDCQDQLLNWKDPCPQGPNLTDLCRESGSCTSAGMPANCGVDGCLMVKGSTFAIPLAGIGSLTDTPNIVVTAVNGGCAGTQPPQ